MHSAKQLRAAHLDVVKAHMACAATIKTAKRLLADAFTLRGHEEYGDAFAAGV